MGLHPDDANRARIGRVESATQLCGGSAGTLFTACFLGAEPLAHHVNCLSKKSATQLYVDAFLAWSSSMQVGCTSDRF